MKCGLKNLIALLQDGQSSLLITLLLFAAFWPVWIWYCQRVCDQSDEPLGIVALLTFIYLLACHQPKNKDQQLAEGSAAADKTDSTSTTTLTTLVAIYCFSLFGAPKLISAALALIAIGISIQRELNSSLNCRLTCHLNSGQWTLLMLSLPLIASLNFYLGYPLRLAVAQCAVSLLSINGFPVVAEGTSLLWHNQLIEIDAPCSGIKMLWAALYMAAVQLTLKRSSVTQAALYLAFAAATAVLANVLRVTSLFYLEAGIIAAPAEIPPILAFHFESAVHTGTGITAFLLVALVLYFTDRRINKNTSPDTTEGTTDKSSVNAKTRSTTDQPTPTAKEIAANNSKRTNNNPFFVACAIAALLPCFSWQKSVVEQEEHWPTIYKGQELRPRSLSSNEADFAKNFPGKIAVFQTDKQTIILRRVYQATRQLHPAADCYRASGFKITNLPRQKDHEGISWNVLLAQKSTKQLQISERIYDDHGQNYTDVSQWYWAAFWGQTRGPWWSITTVRVKE